MGGIEAEIFIIDILGVGNNFFAILGGKYISFAIWGWIKSLVHERFGHVLKGKSSFL